MNLVPEEGFVQDVSQDGSKKFTCKQCGKTCKSKQSVKQHIANTHKKEALKRMASNKQENVGRKAAKKFFEEEDMITEESAGSPIQESTQLDFLDHTSVLDNFCDDHLGEGFLNGDFNLNGTVDRYVDNKKSLDPEESVYISPDQDHNYLETESKEDEEPNLLKARIVSLKLEIQKRDAIINEKDNDLAVAKEELESFRITVNELKKDIVDKNDALDTATAQVNSLEEVKSADRVRINKYGATLRSLIKEKDNDSGSKTSDKEKELTNTIKEKNKKIKEGEVNHKKLADKLAELEKVIDDDKVGSVDKTKNLNNQLLSKTKEAKKSAEEAKKAEKRANELMEIVSGLNKKVSELENSNTRLKLMKEQSKEIIDKMKPETSEKKKTVDDKNVKVKKCKFENTGLCRNKTNCPEFHPKKTCQPHSKLGSCPAESSCEHRHPYGICFEWEKHGACYTGDDCRNRHPFELSRQVYHNQEPFLGRGSPHRDQGGAGGERQGWGNRGGQWSPSQIRHHDQRGQGRW